MNTSQEGKLRPRIKAKAGGGVFITVLTKRGPRARQITSEGWEWIRAKYPAADYPTPDDVPLTYTDYRELQRLDFIYTGKRPKRRRPHAVPEAPAPQPADTPVVFPPDVGTASQTHAWESPVPARSSNCRDCGKALPEEACFCPRCGRVSAFASGERLIGAGAPQPTPAPAEPTPVPQESETPHRITWQTFVLLQIIVVPIVFCLLWLAYPSSQGSPAPEPERKGVAQQMVESGDRKPAKSVFDNLPPLPPLAKKRSGFDIMNEHLIGQDTARRQAEADAKQQLEFARKVIAPCLILFGVWCFVSWLCWPAKPAEP